MRLQIRKIADRALIETVAFGLGNWKQTSDVTGSREGVQGQALPPMPIVRYVGDKIMDFPDLDHELRHAQNDAISAFGDPHIVSPNPMYGSWEKNARDSDRGARPRVSA